MQLVRDKLEAVGPDKRMVESLAPMWDEERQRCGGTGPPDPPPDPLRDPKPLCATVDFVREQFKVLRRKPLHMLPRCASSAPCG